MNIPASVFLRYGKPHVMGVVRSMALVCAIIGLTGGAIVIEQPVALQSISFSVYLPLVVTPATPLTNLPATTATYLGGAGADELNGAGIAPDGTLIVAGALPGYAPPGASLITLPGATNGAVVRLSADGSGVLSVLRFGSVVRDLEINAAGHLIVCGDAGIAHLSADAATVVWSASPGNVVRCAVGADGAAAALIGKTVAVYDVNGAPVAAWMVDGTLANDLMIDSARAQVIVGGYTQVSSTLQLPWVRAYGYDGTLRWRSYDFAAAPGFGADSRVERLALGADGYLYVAGSINGGVGASVFSRDPKDLSTPLGARLVRHDSYSDSTNTGSVKIGWFGRFNPADGSLTLAQALLTRRTSDNRGNSVSIRAIAADARGQVFLAGDAACCIKNRDQQRVAGIAVGPYESGEGYVAVIGADFQQRLIWTPYAGPALPGGSSAARALAVRNGKVLAVATLSLDQTKPRSLITVNAIQPVPGGPVDAEGYLLLWRTP
jgi:hypothetical protein